MDYETTNVSGSKGFFQVERVQWAVLLKTTGCSWRPFFIAIGRGFRGVTRSGNPVQERRQ
jgi:hypothetical protein